jgi:hypothetical protein
MHRFPDSSFIAFLDITGGEKVKALGTDKNRTGAGSIDPSRSCRSDGREDPEGAMATIDNVRELIAVCIAVVEQSSRLFDTLHQTGVGQPDMAPDSLCAVTSSLTDLLARCKRIAVVLERLHTPNGSCGEEESLKVLDEVEVEMGVVSSSLQQVIKELKRRVERCGSDERCDKGLAPRFRTPSSN